MTAIATPRRTAAMHQAPRDKLIEANDIRRLQLPLLGRMSVVGLWAACGTAAGLTAGIIAAINIGGYPWVLAAGAALGLLAGVIGGVRRRSELARRADTLEREGTAEISSMLTRQAQER